MTDKFVDLEALNLRSSPNSSSTANRIAILHLGQTVNEIGPNAGAPDWLDVEVVIDSVKKKGMVKAEIDGLASLRDPVSNPAREALVAEAIKEWLRFEKGQGEENVVPFSDYVGQMWQAIGLKLNGKNRGVPWSAAAISFMVRNAGDTFPKYKNFKFAPAHAEYMHDSVVKGKAKDTSAPFWGFRLYEKHPEIGDIVGKWREKPRDFHDIETRNDFKSHSDLIVSVRPDFVLAIGGNVGQSVNITRYDKTPSGFLAPTNNVIIHMVNQVP